MTRSPGAGLHLHLDPLGGAAGDMFVAAMLDAFPELEPRVMADVIAILPPEAGQAELSRGQSGGLAVRRFALLPNRRGEEAKPRGHQHEHDHGHGHGHHHHATTYHALRTRIETAPLSQGTAAAAAAILHHIALAEAHVHDMPLDEVHFHELADWDALMDVTAAGSICAALEGATWSLTPLPLGGGLVRTAHGALPVPTPATARILQGYEWHDDGIGGERVTPTGAAILAHVTGGTAGTRRGGRLRAVGMGAGTRDLDDRPNILRVTAFAASSGAGADRIVQLACDLDDMTGEEIAAAADALRAHPGVADLVLVSLLGKKGRPATRMELMVYPAAEAAVAAAIFDLTSSLGLRRTELDRLILPRSATISVEGIRVKRADRPSGATAKAESDDLVHAPTLRARRQLAHRTETG
ncbi:LarC family nickel insertion protein [Sinirhodobacter populi]|uniref:LarC family nickel insertion protein n=1 Tax=Paenirhodobacter populi TaxID=2306993 RepID=A0A443K2U2_9RHOB|nr:LarC family nickel insertion protein [Sinirhodobacter populi]RWR27087.1 LarC family nickel insertion protein [Sinirhodobacter populi]